MSAEFKAELAQFKADIGPEIKSLVAEQLAELPEALTAEKLVEAFGEQFKSLAEIKLTDDIEKRIGEIETKLSRDIEPEGETKSGPRTLGQAFTDTETFQIFSKKRTQESCSIELKGDLFGFSLEHKAADQSFAGHTVIGELDKRFEYAPMILTEYETSRVRDLFPVTQISGDTVYWVKEDVAYELYTELSQAEGSGETVISVKNAGGFYQGLEVSIAGITGTRLVDSVDVDASTVTLTAVLGGSGAADNARMSGTTFTWTAEGELAPSALLNTTSQTDTVQDLSITMDVAVNMLEDAPATAQYVDNRLRLFAGVSEDREFLTGADMGLFNNTDIQTYNMSSGPASDTYADAIRRTVTQVALSHFSADAVVLATKDLEAIECEKDDLGRYLHVMATDSAGISRIWRLRVIASTALAAGKALVGAFRVAVMLWVRMATAVNIYRQHKDYAARRLALIMATQRALLTVLRPSAIFIVDFLN